ncbi:MAG: hypothetical protein AAF530_01530 [Pseudomonadota bacterium]
MYSAREMRAYKAWANDLTPDAVGEPVCFSFIGGRPGRITRWVIALHKVNHATDHRGYVDDMLYHVPAVAPATDFTVFLGDQRLSEGADP